MIKILITILVGLFFPVLAIAYLVMPGSSVGRIMRQPFIKFICHSVSYIFFLSMFVNIWTLTIDRPCSSLLVLLFVVSLRIDFGKLLTGIEEEASERRGPPPNPVEFAVR